jgi:hypothetical protein
MGLIKDMTSGKKVFENYSLELLNVNKVYH